MLDARILEFNYLFLKSLELKRNLISSQIRLIAIKDGPADINKGIGGTYTKQYTDLNSLVSSNTILSLSTGEKECQYGDSTIIENVYISNQNLPFPNSFHLYNISSGSIRIVDDVQLNKYNDEFYLSEIERFKTLLIEIFTGYRLAWIEFKKYIDECYVKSCYVDPNYDCGDFDDPTVVLKLSDLFIDAGPNVVVWMPLQKEMNTGPLNTV